MVFHIVPTVPGVSPVLCNTAKKYFYTPLLFLPKEWQLRGYWDYADYVKITPILFVES
jgi:hypothetical protein